jgi:hypothetical protein
MQHNVYYIDSKGMFKTRSGLLRGFPYGFLGLQGA